MPNKNRDVNPALVRGARALLGWSTRELANRSGVSLPTIHRFEVGSSCARPQTVDALLKAFDKAGIVFLSDGVRLLKLVE